MALTLRIQGSGAVPGRSNTLAMTGEALTIGRAEGNDLILPDPDRVVSSRHCVLEDRGGDYVLIDISTNGTFLNYAPQPVGAMPAPLSDGDVIGVGRYEIRVEIAGAARRSSDPFADLPPPLEDARVAPRTATQQVGSGEDFLRALDDPGSGGRDFLDDLLNEGPNLSGRGASRVEEPDHLAELLGPDPLDPLAPAPDPAVRGASVADHSASPQDYFRPAAAQRSIIPDDWDEDVAAPVAAPARQAPPAPRAATPPPAALIPEDEDLLVPPPPAPPEPAQRAAPAPRSGALIPDDSDFLAPLPPPGRAAPRPAEPSAADPFAEPVAPDPIPVAPPPVAEAPREALRPAPPDPGPAAVPRPAAPRDPGPGGDAAARAFLRAAGVEKLDLSDEDLLVVMERMGAAFRIMVTGLREVLMARASIKNELRLGQTVISKDGNNPIKFSISADHAMEAMARPATPGYLPATEAAAQALDDIKAHEVAMMTGMQAAIQGLLSRFDPEKLASRIETGTFGGILGNRKGKLWDQFEQLYGQIAQEAEDDFQTLFGKEFARAYQAQLKKL